MFGLAFGKLGRQGAPAAAAPEPVNIIANGTFDDETGWLLAGGWSISGGKAVGTGATNYLRQNGALSVGVDYRCTFDYTMTSGNALRAGSATGPVNTDPLGASGSVEVFFTAGHADFAIEAVGAPFTGTVDNLVVAEV